MSIKQSHKEPSTLGDDPSESLPACWHRDRDRDCLRVETLAGEVFLLPYQQFVGAHFKRHAQSEILSIAFSSHQLTVHGRNLEEIVSALQEFAVDWIVSTPSRFQSLRNGSSATVLTVEIEAID